MRSSKAATPEWLSTNCLKCVAQPGNSPRRALMAALCVREVVHPELFGGTPRPVVEAVAGAGVDVDSQVRSEYVREMGSRFMTRCPYV